MSGFRAPVDLKMLHVYRQVTSAGPAYIAGNFSKELAADPSVDPCTKYVGAYVPERVCAACKYWNPRDMASLGECQRVGQHSSEAQVEQMAGVGDVMRFRTDGGFGCVLHEEKAI